MPLPEKAGIAESEELAELIKKNQSPGIIICFDDREEPGVRIAHAGDDETLCNMIYSVLIGEPEWMEIFYNALMNADEYIKQNGFSKK